MKEEEKTRKGDEENTEEKGTVNNLYEDHFNIRQSF